MIRTGFRFSAATFWLLIVAASFIPVRRIHALDGFTSPRNADIDTRGIRSIRIEGAAGILKVDGKSNISEVRVRGTARSSRRNHLDDIRLIAERRGDQIFIKADMPDINGSNIWGVMRGEYNQMMLDLVIEVPVNLPLDVTDGSGEAEFNNTGALEVDDGSGELWVRGSHGNVRIRDGSGNVTVDGVQGSVTVDDGSGNIRATNITGNLTVEEDGSGDIDVSGIGGTMRVESDGSGNIDVDRVAGDFVVDNDGSGIIRYDTVKGSVRIPEKKRRS
jgi:DUF4097 and DUF4098 domain-containing protein YvlB